MCGVLTDGTVKCFSSDNSSGQFGANWRTIATPPTTNRIYTLDAPAAQVAIGARQVCLVSSAGQISCEGAGYWGPTRIDSMSSLLGITTAPAASVSIGMGPGNNNDPNDIGFDCAVEQSHSLRCWGYDGVTGYPYGFRVMGSGPSVSVSPSAFACGALDDGGVSCWGVRASAVRFDQASLPPVTQVASGPSHVCALSADREVWCWGSNALGQSGSPDGGPTRVPNLGDIVQIAVGSFHSCALSAGGAVTCWGDNSYGRVGGPSPFTLDAGATRVAASPDTTCVLQADGVRCWGWRAALQVRTGTAPEMPVLMPFDL